MKNAVQPHTINFSFFHIKKDQLLIKSNNTAYIL